MEEKIFFSNSKGDRLCGILDDPTNLTSTPIVIVCHWFSTHKNSMGIVPIAKVLNENSIATLRIDLFGHGESDGKLEDITISEGVDDILQAVAYLVSRWYSKIGLMGSSFWGICSSIATSKTDQIAFLALRAPVSNYVEQKLLKIFTTGIEQRRTEWYIIHDWKRLGVAFLNDAEKNAAYAIADKITVPTLIVHGSADTNVPVQHSEKLASLIPHCELQIIDWADHGFSHPEHNVKMVRYLSDFLIQHAKL